jgi:cell wall-associated NlpC family hydrolase
VQWAYKQVGVNLPRSTYEQVNVGTPVSKANLQPGDLVFSYADNHHVGIYAGDGKVLNAVDSGDVVRYSELSRVSFNTARRI